MHIFISLFTQTIDKETNHYNSLLIHPVGVGSAVVGASVAGGVGVGVGVASGVGVGVGAAGSLVAGAVEDGSEDTVGSV